jgi:hypothetical protein
MPPLHPICKSHNKKQADQHEVPVSAEMQNSAPKNPS